MRGSIFRFSIHGKSWGWGAGWQANTRAGDLSINAIPPLMQNHVTIEYEKRQLSCQQKNTGVYFLVNLPDNGEKVETVRNLLKRRNSLKNYINYNDMNNSQKVKFDK